LSAGKKAKQKGNQQDISHIGIINNPEHPGLFAK